jgi:hypothetical protein
VVMTIQMLCALVSQGYTNAEIGAVVNRSGHWAEKELRALYGGWDAPQDMPSAAKRAWLVGEAFLRGVLKVSASA